MHVLDSVRQDGQHPGTADPVTVRLEFDLTTVEPDFMMGFELMNNDGAVVLLIAEHRL